MDGKPSATCRRTEPTREPPPSQPTTCAPLTTSGSNPHSASRWPSMAVTVDLPHVPATATSLRPASSSERAAARWTTGMPRSRAAARSGLSSSMAVDITSRPVASVTPDPSSSDSRTPWLARASRTGVRPPPPRNERSEPDTPQPASRYACARALIPTPPMPTRWTFPGKITSQTD